jgi:cold shock CspA family protein
MTNVHGVLKNWNFDRGFGWIQAADTGQLYFLHVTNWVDSGRRPVAGQKIIFDVGPGTRGYEHQATNARSLAVFPEGTTMRTATILQLVPMPDRWECHTLHRSGLTRWPMLGLALVDLPFRKNAIVHFGEGDQDFLLFNADVGTSPFVVHGFYQNNEETRVLGIAPVGSGDDYFAQEIAEGVVGRSRIGEVVNSLTLE